MHNTHKNKYTHELRKMVMGNENPPELYGQTEKTSENNRHAAPRNTNTRQSTPRKQHQVK